VEIVATRSAGRADPPWWLLVLLGALMAGVGIWLLANLVESVLLLAVLIGLSLVVGGVLDAMVLGRDRPRWVGWAEGLLLVGAGAVVLAWPDITLWVLAISTGLALVLGGLVGVAVAFHHRHRSPAWTLELGLAALGVVTGTLILAWPEATVVVVAVVYGIRTTVVGVMAIASGWQLRRARDAAAVSAAST
jgi:uncharacterized membrane protein HdeD (DUF308 family)